MGMVMRVAKEARGGQNQMARYPIEVFYSSKNLITYQSPSSNYDLLFEFTNTSPFQYHLVLTSWRYRFGSLCADHLFRHF